MTTNAIEMGQDGESQVFTASRDVRNSDHANGTIRQGERVFFRQAEGEIVLADVENGEPTNGNQYVRFDSLADAQVFADRAGLRADHATTDNTERWYAFRAYNSQTEYGYGTESEAGEYADYLNRGREINQYSAYAMGGDGADEDTLVAALDNQDRNDGFTLSEALAEIGEIDAN